MAKALLFDMSAGVSGDMILGGLFALGFDPEKLNAVLRAWKLPVSVSANAVQVHGLQAVKANVEGREIHPPQRGLREFRQLLESAPIPEGVRHRAAQIFQRLAEVEAEVHGIPVEDVHFHELGGLDTLVDILGASLGFSELGVERCWCTPFPFGQGVVSMEHGVFPEPAPATLLLTRGFPSHRTGWQGEHCTPTGAAIVSSCAEPVPPEWTSMLLSVGYGAGTRNPGDRANVLRLCLHEENEATDAEFSIFQIECNLDNATPEQIAFTVERLFKAGCFDAWQEAIVMKKGRSAVKLCALASQSHREKALEIIASETPTGGLRWFPVRRLVAKKHSVSVPTPLGEVEVKTQEFPVWNIHRVRPEYESLRKMANQHGISLRAAQAASQQALGEGA